MDDDTEEKNHDGQMIDSIEEIVDVSSHELLKNDDDSLIKPIETIVEVRSQIRLKEHEMMPAGLDSLEENTANPRTTSPIITTLRGKKSRSASCAHSRDPRKCQMPFRKMVDKHGIRNEELVRREGDLRKRLDMLEVSMPAVMVYNILRMTQDAPPSALQFLIKKQFQSVNAASNIVTPSTLSQHYDFRVREIYAERKEALRRVEDARALLAAKEAAIKERQKYLEDVKKYNQDKKECVARLNRDAAEMRLATKNARDDDQSSIGKCCEISSKENLFNNIDSLSSIGSADLERFAKLEELAMSEVCMKRRINELERREEAYMRTIQQADELWYNMKGDVVGSATNMREQLNLKTAANQQLADRICHLEDELERSNKLLIGCKYQLKKYTSKEYVDVEAGFEDSVAGVVDRGIVAAVKVATASNSVAPNTVDAMSITDLEMVDRESSIVPEYTEKGSSVHMKTSDKYSDTTADRMGKPIDTSVGLGIDVGLGGTRIDGFDDEAIPEELEDWDWEEGCPSKIVCGNVVESSTETDDFQRSLEPPFSEKKPNDTIEEDKRLSTKNLADGNASATDQIIISREELRNWYNIVDSAHHTISKCADCSPKIDLMAQLAEKMKYHLSIPLVKIPTGIRQDLNAQAVECQAGTPVLYPSTTKMDIEPATSTDEHASLIVKSAMILSAEKLQDTNVLDAPSPLVTLDTAKPLEALNEFSETLKPYKHTMEEPSDVPDRILPVDSPEGFSQVSVTEIVESISLEIKDIKEQSLIRSIDAKILDNFGHLSEHESGSSAISKKVIIEEDVGGKMIDFLKEPEIRSEQSLSQPGITVDVVTKKDEIEPQATAVPDSLLKLTAEGRILEEEDTLEESSALSIISSASAFFEPDAQRESKELLPSMIDLKDEPSGPSAADAIPALVPLAESKIQTDGDELLLIKDVLHDVIEDIIEEIVERRPVLSPEMVETLESHPEVVSKPKEESFEEPSKITVAEDELGTITIPLVVKDEDVIKEKTAPLAYTIPPLDRKILEIATEKLLEKIPTDAPSMKICQREPCESDGKLTSPADSVRPSICKFSPWHLPDESVCPRQKLKIPRQDTEGTQTTLQFPRTLDKLKLKMITGSTWPSTDVVMWRRSLVRSRRPKDKSTLTTVCVDTQTDNAFVRKKITHQSAQRKNNYACAGVAAIKTNVDSYQKPVSSCNTNKQLASASFIMNKIFSLTRPSSASITEKEIPAVSYTDKYRLAKHSELHCDECGRTLTSENLPLTTKSNLRTSIEVENIRTDPLNNISSSPTSCMGQKNNEFTCCKCKIFETTGIENGTRKKKEFEEGFNCKTFNKEICCPCPTDDAEKMAIKMLKSSTKRRKPEKKNQSVMAYTPMSKCKKMKTNRMLDDLASDTPANNNTEKLPNNQCTFSGIGSSNILSPGAKHSESLAANVLKTKSTTDKRRLKSETSSYDVVAKVGSVKEVLQCTCDEDGSVHIPYTKYSSIFKLNISKDGCTRGNGINKVSRKNLDSTCDDSAFESFPIKSCNSKCADLRK